MEQFGLGWERLHAVNPELIMVRMPAFGLDGPWRDHTGFAQTMECVTGMAWMTGFADGPPTLVRGACDPLAGMHAAIATLLALLERDVGGGGRLVESVMAEAALNAAAEQVIEYTTSGKRLCRDGNRGPDAAPQGVYPCAGEDAWVAVAVANDEQWRQLVTALDEPAWMAGAEHSTAAGRRAAHDAIDKELAAWTSRREAADVADRQLRHRRLFEVEHHPVTGDHELPGLPFRFSRVSSWLPRPSPTIGQHNAEVLAEIGLSPAEIEALAADRIIGQRPTGL
jgi:crotonobetainyl-CoA:carnitine CoA-transferase CaiB-like acyl-CoA transferase